MQRILSWLKGCGRSALTSASWQLNQLQLNDLYTDRLTCLPTDGYTYHGYTYYAGEYDDKLDC